MKISLQKLVIHNFLSIGDVELNLANRGCSLIEGRNNNPADGAFSNGSGKSSLWNALCWVITGETINGLKTNIPNIYGEDGCFVTLLMDVDGESYEITRYRDYGRTKNDLKIKINGVDKSGKGLRESEELLSQYLPDLTSDLIGNVIILGQGLPHKFSNNTPAGRKELLETLSRSDFMIQDIKDRLNLRSTELSNQLRGEEDNLLKLETSKEVNLKRVEDFKTQLSTLPTSTELEDQLQENVIKEKLLREEQENLLSQYNKLNEVYTKQNLEMEALKTQESEQRQQITEKWDSQISDQRIQMAECQANIKNLTGEISRLESITDVCPTCGQKLPGVLKPDTTDQKTQLNKMQNMLKDIQDSINQLQASKEKDLTEVKLKYEASRSAVEKTPTQYIQELDTLKNQSSLKQQEIERVVNSQIDLKIRIDSLAATRKTLQDKVAELSAEVSDLDQKIMYNKESVQNTQDHIEALNKINSLVKRDFRGVLLSSAIEFLDKRIKEYSKYVFNTQDLNLVLEGNNVNITFCNKAYSNLSGGEKQKVDIIIQLAIRDMMCQYLNFSSNVLVIDECFDGLDAVGCDKILDLINTCVRDVDSLFIISHHSETLQIPADEIITIEKDEKGISRIVR